MNAVDQLTLNEISGPASHGGFATRMAPRLLLAEYDSNGWRADIRPYGPLALDPATAALHYGQSVFEGLKAFRGGDGEVRLFRPRAHLERLNASARRLAMPPVDVDLALGWLVDLVRDLKDSVPAAPGESLYLRPVMFASEAFLGVRPARRYTCLIIAAAGGAYYDTGRPLRLRVEDVYTRAAPGGSGAAKTGGNYAVALLPTEVAHAEGFDDVLWLDAHEHHYLEEAGTMNVFVRIGDEVLTPSLDGTLLAGVTRDSILALLRDWGIAATERRIDIDEVIDAAQSGRLQEMWGSGTAAVIAPVGEFAHRGQRFSVSGGLTGGLTRRLFAALTAIQRGGAVDSHEWTLSV